MPPSFSCWMWFLPLSSCWVPLWQVLVQTMTQTMHSGKSWRSYSPCSSLRKSLWNYESSDGNLFCGDWNGIGVGLTFYASSWRWLIWQSPMPAWLLIVKHQHRRWAAWKLWSWRDWAESCVCWSSRCGFGLGTPIFLAENDMGWVLGWNDSPPKSVELFHHTYHWLLFVQLEIFDGFWYGKSSREQICRSVVRRTLPKANSKQACPWK